MAPLDRRKTTWTALALFAFFFSVYFLTMQGVRLGSDEVGMFLVTESLVNERNVYIDGSWSESAELTTCRGGRICTKFPLGQSLAEIPLYTAAKLLIGNRPQPDIFGPSSLLYFVTSLTNPLLGAGACVLLFFFCLRLGYGRRWSIFLAALLGLGTLAWPYAKLLMSETLQMFSLLGCVYFIYAYSKDGRKCHAALAGFLCGFMLLAKFFLAPVAPALAVYFFVKMRRRGEKRPAAAIACFLLPAAALFSLIPIYNYARFGSLFQSGYFLYENRDAVFRFTVPLLSGAHGLLFSSGKGLFFYVPATAAACAAMPVFIRRHRDEGILAVVVAIALVATFSKWNQWHGDFAWGPRFLVPLMPFVALPLGALRDTWLTNRRRLRAVLLGLLLALSIFIQFLGVSMKTGAYLALAVAGRQYQVFYRPNDTQSRDYLLNQHFVPEFSPLVAHWWMFRHTLLDGNLEPAERERLMQRDYPWKSLVRDGAPQDPLFATGWAFWHWLIPHYAPDSAGWVRPLLAANILLFLVSSCIILIFVKQKGE